MQFAVGSKQQHPRGYKLAAMDRGVAHPLKQLFARTRAQDRFVGCTQRREHPGQMFPAIHPRPLLAD